MSDERASGALAAAWAAQRVPGRALARWAGGLGALFGRGRDVATIRMLQAELAAQTAAAAQLRETARAGALFERAAATAGLGIWACELPSQRLTWSRGTYDLFDLPHGAALRREEIVETYTDESRGLLEETRSRAIEARQGFGLDLEIVTPHDRRRWIRVTAAIDCLQGRPVRVYGVKRDVTEEKLLWERTRYLVEFDAMTGLASRTQFDAAMIRHCAPQAGGGPAPVLMLVDLDGFKAVNDTYGHAAGDDCLTEAAGRLEAACREAELVARFGGDEFAVILGPGHSNEAVATLASRIVQVLARPTERCGHALRIGASVGIARAEDCTPSELFDRADAALYAAKAAGRNGFRSYTPGLARA